MKELKKGKIIKALSGYYYVLSDGGETYQCRARGVFRKRNISPLVGDNVSFAAENVTDGYIYNVFSRTNELVRPPISNVDQALLVFSVKQPKLNLKFLDKLLVHIESNAIMPIICLTKMDLLATNEGEEVERAKEIYEAIGYLVLLLSSTTEENNEKLCAVFEGKTTVVAGQSGVGKSTLLNRLDQSLNLKTREISTHLGRGKHTTRHVELLPIGNGLVADTPGFSSLDFSNMEEEMLSHYFIEMRTASERCRFRVCTHISEPGCSVQELVETGTIASSRYEHYKMFFNEIKETKRRY